MLGLDKMARLRLKALPQACIADDFESCVGECNDLLSHQLRADRSISTDWGRFTSHSLDFALTIRQGKVESPTLVLLYTHPIPYDDNK